MFPRTLQKRILLFGMAFLLVAIIVTGVSIWQISQNLFSAEAYADAMDTDLATLDDSVEVYFERAATTFFYQSLLIMGLVVIFLGGLSWLSIRRLFRPVRELTSTIDNLDTNSLPKSIHINNRHAEIQKLQQAFNRMLKEVNATLENQKRFAANAAHELKTPISSILANLEVHDMEATPASGDCQEILKITKENTERMRTLVESLMELTQVERIERETFKLKDIRLITPEQRALAEEKHIEIHTEGDTTIKASKHLFERALQNLIHNAIRYNKKGGDVYITAEEGAIYIRDTGPGIPEAKQDKVFQPFYCVDPSRSRAAGGNGLGLSIVKQIMDAHQFTIDIDSAAEKGTTITIHLDA